MKNVVLFSGGLDSTLTVLKMARQITEHCYPNNTIYLLYSHDWNYKDSDKISSAFKIYEQLVIDFPAVNFKLVTIPYYDSDDEFLAFDFPAVNFRLVNIPYYNSRGKFEEEFNSAMVWYTDFIKKGLDELLKEKEAIRLHVTQTMDSTFSQMKKRTKLIVNEYLESNNLDEHLVQVLREMKNKRMDAIVRSYAKDKTFVKYLDLVWTCDYPQGVKHTREDNSVDIEHCCYCSSCKAFIAALTGIIFEKDIIDSDNEVINKLLQVLQRRFRIDLLEEIKNVLEKNQKPSSEE